MYHSITFGDKNTWDDWHLVPQTRPVLLPPDVKTNYVDIPGADGHLDLTEALVGEPLYKNRTGSIDFYVMNGYQSWEQIYSIIMNYLHGQKMKVFLEDDPGFYYEGRFSVNTWKSEKHRSEIVIDYDVGPYKIDFYSTADRWLWDPFNFDIGIIREYYNLYVNQTLTVNIIGSRRSYIPTIKSIPSLPQYPITMTWSGTGSRNYVLQYGENKFPDVKIKEGESTLTFSGFGYITIDYRGGSL